METFKVGDLVKVKENISLEDDFISCPFVPAMLKYRGHVTRIENIEDIIISEHNYERYKLSDIEDYVFDPEMLEPIYKYSITSDSCSLVIDEPEAVSSLPEITITQPILKFKVGDKVRIKTNLEVNKQYGEHVFVSSMKDFKGAITIVRTILTNGYYLDGCNTWIFTDDMLELVEESSIKLKDSETLKLFL